MVISPVEGRFPAADDVIEQLALYETGLCETRP